MTLQSLYGLNIWPITKWGRGDALSTAEDMQNFIKSLLPIIKDIIHVTTLMDTVLTSIKRRSLFIEENREAATDVNGDADDKEIAR